MIVCGICGVPIGVKAAGGYVHLDSPGKEFDVHDAGHPTDPEIYAQAIREEFDVRLLAQELLDHHLGFHPLTDCPWAQKMSIAIRKR